MLLYGPLDFTVQDVWLQVSDHIIVVIWLIKTLMTFNDFNSPPLLFIMLMDSEV